MTYEEYKKQKEQQSVNRYEEYKKNRTSQKVFDSMTKGTQFIVNVPKTPQIDTSNLDLTNVQPTTTGVGDTLTDYENTRMLHDSRDFNVVKSGGNTLGKGVMLGTANTIDATYAVGTKALGNDATVINAENLLKDENLLDKISNFSKGYTNFLGKGVPVYEFAHQMMGFNQTSKESWEMLEKIYKDNPDNKQLERVYNELKNGTYKGSVEDLERELSEIQTTIANEFKAKYTDDERMRFQQQLAENQDKYGTGMVNKTLSAVGTVGQMVPTMLAGTINPTAGTVAIGLGAGGSAYNQALDSGAQFNEAFNYGVASGVAEAVIEQFGGDKVNKALGIKTKGPANKILTGLNKINNKYVRGGLELGKEIAEEGLEEVATTFIDPALQMITYNPEANYDNMWQDMFNSFEESIIPTLLMGGIGTARNKVQTFTNETISKINANTNLTPEQKASAIEQVQQKAKEANEKIDKVENNTTNNTNIAETSPNNEQISQNNVQNDNKLNVKKIKNKTPSWNLSFAEQIDEYVSGTLKTGNLLYLGETPNVLRQLGYNNNPITLKQSELKTIMKQSDNPNSHNHGISTDIIKKLPEAIANPLNILKSSTDVNSIVVITDLADNMERPIIASIQIDSKGQVGNIKFLSNELTSTYGKRNYEEFMDREIAKGNLIYDIDEGIIKEPPATGLQLSKGIDSSDVSSTTNTPINNIIPNGQNYVNNQNILPSTEQLQAQDKKQGEEAYNTLNMKKTNNKNPNFMLVDEKDSYKRNMFNNNAKAINDLIKAKNNSMKEIETKIKAKQNELDGKKDKTTKLAQNIQRQIINLEKRKADVEQEYIKKIDRLENRNANINKLKKQVSENRIPTRKEIKEKIITEKDLDSYNFDNVKEISKFKMNNTTPERVMEKIFDRETAMDLNNNFIKPIKHNEAERIRFMNTERQEIENLGIKAKTAESSAVQKYGEGVVVNETTGEETEYTLKDLQAEFPNDWEKIKNASEVIRNKYDTYLDAINQVLNENGYDSIPKLKNYFRHFEAIKNVFDQIGIPTKENLLPTDMNGLTADLKPGKNFFANALSRTGKKTTYDAITGIDGYLEGASKMIYHTEDIQKLRALDDYIRKKYGQQTDLSNLQGEEFNTRVEQIQNNHLSEFASWLTEYTNNLAGKKSKMDRGTEEALGRKVYGALNFLKKQVGSNLTGLNLNSALSNFISITQAGAKTSKIAMSQGLGDTFKNIFVNDGFINKSDFLTRRFGSDKLSKTWWEKASNAGQIFMSGTDYFSANLITRSKYNEYLNKGYPEAEAMKKADEFADRLMGGRALGDMPNIFNSKTLGILTQFQLENVNQFDSMFHDTMYENRAEEQTQYEAKTWNEKIKKNLAKSNPKFYNGLTATFILGQLFTYAWLFNKVDEEITGSPGAFDIFGLIEKTIKDFTNPDITKEQATKNLIKNIIDQIPYANIVTGGGRVPMTDALPNIDKLLSGESGWEEIAWQTLNLISPTGGGQIRKTVQGADALLKGGDYTSDGRLKFPVAQEENKFLEGAQALLFGKWATPGGQKYIDSGFKSLSKVETEGLEKAKDLDISVKEFYDIMERIKDIEVPTRKNKEGKDEAIPGARKKLIKNELNQTNLNDEQKKLMYDIFYKQEVK